MFANIRQKVMMKMKKGHQTDHSQQVTSGRQPSVVRNLHAISGQMRQLRVFDGHLETWTTLPLNLHHELPHRRYLKMADARENIRVVPRQPAARLIHSNPKSLFQVIDSPASCHVTDASQETRKKVKI